MEEIEIRFTIKKDLEELPWLYRQYYCGDTKVETNYHNMLKEYNKLIKNQDYKFVSAVYHDTLIGFCSIVVNHDIVEKQKPIIMLWNLRIHPEFRKQGVGKKIISFIEDFGKSINADLVFLTCDLENIGAQSFYKRIGYKKDYTFYKFL